MNNYEDWAQLVAKNLKGEGELIAAIDKEELDDAAATQAFIRAVLEPFLPENFGIGHGRVVDAFGNYSDNLDIIIYNRDFPRIGMRGTHSVFLYESVFAVFSIRAKFVRKTFFDALTSCASMGDLSANIDKLTLAKLAKKNGLTRDSSNKFVHRDPLSTARFNLIGRPPTFMFGFVGMKQSYRQLQENIQLWIEQRRKSGAEAEMKSLPAVIATQGCFAWRNAAPLALSNREMLGIGNDPAPVRLIILQLLYLLNRRLSLAPDSYGLKPNLKSYLNQFSPPKFELGVGNLADVVSLKPATENEQKAMEESAGQRFEPARDRAAAPPSVKTEPGAEPKPAKAAAPVPEPTPEPVKAAEPSAALEPVKAAPAPESRPAPEPVKAGLTAPEPEKTAEPAEKSDSGVQFESGFKPSTPPPVDSENTTDKADEPPRFGAPISAPLGSAPIPTADADESMPVPEMPADPEPEPEAKPAAVSQKSTGVVIPPKPPVDIDLGFGGGDSAGEPAAEALPDKENESEDDFAQTVVMPPPGGNQPEENARNSTDAFIARVKEQLSSSDPVKDPDAEQDFTSTVPQ